MIKCSCPKRTFRKLKNTSIFKVKSYSTAFLITPFIITTPLIITLPTIY